MKFAIVESGGKQYRAVEGGTLEVDRLPVNTGESVKLEQVLLLADGENVLVGAPVVKDNPVWTKVVEHFKGEKVTIFNYSPKKRIRVKTGHRQKYTRLFVEQVGGSMLLEKKPVETEKAVEAKIDTAKDKKSTATTVKKPAASSTAKKATTAKAASTVSVKGTASSKAEKPAVKTPAKAEKKPAITAAKKTTASKAAPKKTTTTKPSSASPAKGTTSSKAKKPAAK